MNDTLLVVDEDTGELIFWKKCAVKNCKNGVCYALQSRYCYPHSINGTLKAVEKTREEEHEEDDTTNSVS